MWAKQVDKKLELRNKNQLSRRNNELSVMSLHRLERHEFDWENVRIIDKESSYIKRIVSEMVFIKR